MAVPQLRSWIDLVYKLTVLNVGWFKIKQLLRTLVAHALGYPESRQMYK